MVFFVAGGVLFGHGITAVIFKLFSASYDRSSMDKIMEDLLGDFTFEDILTHELFVVSYSYNEQEPRFFSKFFQNQNPDLYKVPIGKATGASAAAPTYFDPQKLTTGIGF